LTVVESAGQWRDALAAGFAKDDTVLVEAIVSGTEITVGLLDGQALPVVEIVPPEGLFDYDAKYTYSRGKTEYFCPPRSLAEDIQAKARQMGESAYAALDGRDMLRVDMIIDDRDSTPRILEANSLPGFTATSLLPKAAAAAGIPFERLCVRLVEAAAARGATADG
jgi:D-alanine-D-alanine ligase